MNHQKIMLRKIIWQMDKDHLKAMEYIETKHLTLKEKMMSGMESKPYCLLFIQFQCQTQTLTFKKLVITFGWNTCNSPNTFKQPAV
jgi:hypothetical protein